MVSIGNTQRVGQAFASNCFGWRLAIPSLFSARQKSIPFVRGTTQGQEILQLL
jgi:hypothetical protein